MHINLNATITPLETKPAKAGTPNSGRCVCCYLLHGFYADLKFEDFHPKGRSLLSSISD